MYLPIKPSYVRLFGHLSPFVALECMVILSQPIAPLLYLFQQTFSMKVWGLGFGDINFSLETWMVSGLCRIFLGYQLRSNPATILIISLCFWAWKYLSLAGGRVWGFKGSVANWICEVFKVFAPPQVVGGGRLANLPEGGGYFCFYQSVCELQNNRLGPGQSPGLGLAGQSVPKLIN